jgi:hypothetical protein
MGWKIPRSPLVRDRGQNVDVVFGDGVAFLGEEKVMPSLHTPSARAPDHSPCSDSSSGIADCGNPELTSFSNHFMLPPQYILQSRGNN